MKPIRYTHVIFGYCLFLWVLFFILTLLLERPETYALNFRDQGRIIQGVLYCLVGIVCCLMTILLYRINKTRHKDVVEYLMGYFGLTTIGILLQGVFSIIEFQIRDFQTFYRDWET